MRSAVDFGAGNAPLWLPVRNIVPPPPSWTGLSSQTTRVNPLCALSWCR
ncbi:hypothetical protein F4009_16235 [Candidatus Poribacteria bacterium]|nr:hypothetical protein [Candidatus Poribacteria bacterium]MYH79296.1 hypothetical protein [Candidatus Poribacteria bacterium]MYK95519.1 hypothetical protein [Candidatus Poribacteria bacterium]